MFRQLIRLIGSAVILCSVLFTICGDEHSNEKKYDVRTQKYIGNEGEIVITYPEFYGVQENINLKIREEALLVLKYYLPDIPHKLTIQYNVIYINENCVSIVYEGSGRLESSSRENFYVYSTNLNLKSGDKIRLEEVVNVNLQFVEIFLDAAKEQLSNEKYEFIVRNKNKEKLLKYLRLADRLDYGIGEQYDVFSYFDARNLYIVFPLADTIGGSAVVRIHQASPLLQYSN